MDLMETIIYQDKMAETLNTLVKLIQCLCSSVYELENKPSDINLQNTINNEVANIVQFSLDNKSNKEGITYVYNILIETYMRVIMMDLKQVQNVMDTLVMARMIIGNLMEDTE